MPKLSPNDTIEVHVTRMQWANDGVTSFKTQSPTTVVISDIGNL